MLERIRKLCRIRGISIAKLEKLLGFANGSIAKSDEKIQAGRLWQIADFFQVSMEFLMFGTVEDPNIDRVINMIIDLGYTICLQNDYSVFIEKGYGNLHIEPGDDRVFDIIKYRNNNYTMIRPHITILDFRLLDEKLQNALSHMLNDHGSLLTNNEFVFNGRPEKLAPEEMEIVQLYKSKDYRELMTIIFDKMEDRGMTP